jgi:hypothetical protein
VVDDAPLKILFLTHYYPPEVNAPASRTFEHCVRWARAGHDVTVVTCAPNCPDGVVFEGYRNRLRRQVEMVDGVRVVRVWTYLAKNAGTVRRITNYLSYMFSAILACLRLPRPDVVIATSPQFFCGWAGVWVSRLKRCRFVLEIRDIWPESIRAVGALKNGLLLRSLEFLERRLYRAADHIVTVGNGYRERVLEKFDRPERISVITNGVDLQQFEQTDPDDEFRRRWGLDGKFVCSYIGTIGMAHGLEVVLKAARSFQESGRTDVKFLFVGDGAQREWLQVEAKESGLDDLVVFTGRLSKNEMPKVLANSDACLIHLRGCELFGSVIPSKIFEIMAMQRPIIMGVRGEACDIVMESGAGLEMEPDSPESLVACIENLIDTPGLAQQLDSKAREYVAQKFSRDVLASRFLTMLESLTGQNVTQPTSSAASEEPLTETARP